MNKNAKEMAKRAKRGFVKALKRFELCENDDGSVRFVLVALDLDWVTVDTVFPPLVTRSRHF